MEKVETRAQPRQQATDGDVLAMVARATARAVTEILADRIQALRNCVREQEQLFAHLPDTAEYNEIVGNFRATQLLLGQIEADLKQFLERSAGHGENHRAA